MTSAGHAQAARTRAQESNRTAAPKPSVVATRPITQVATRAPAAVRLNSFANSPELRAAAAQVRAESAAPRSEAGASSGVFMAGGQPIAPDARTRLESTFGVGLGGVRVHSDDRARRAAQGMGARAFTYGNRVFLGPGASQTDRRLLGHEVAHVLQQQDRPAPQAFSADANESLEREAQQASAAVAAGASFTVQGRTAGPTPQGLGLSDALNYFADKANLIPGFRMFTLIIGVNPINGAAVSRNTANILRAVIEFLPGGGLITQALDNYGIVDKVANWVDQQLKSLGLAGSAFISAIKQFLGSLSWRDIFDLGGVWERAKRIFTEPIDRIKSFVGGLVSGIIEFVKDAILMPLAKLAAQTKGWDLLCAVLGKNPITGEAVPRNAETLIGGFMKLIGQEEVWENIKRGNAISRAWAWFQGALEGLLGFVRQIPQLFLDALKSLQITDLVLLPQAFAKVGRAFGSFIGNFLSWAGNTVWNLLEIIFSVVAPAVVGYLKKAAGAFRTILKNPIGFVRNLVNAGKQGLNQFVSKFAEHLKASIIGWLTGTLAGAGIYIPKAFSLAEIGKCVLSVIGIGWQKIRSKIVKALGSNGETIMKSLETAFDVVVALVKGGLGAAWELIKEKLTDLRDVVLQSILGYVRDRIVTKAITTLVSLLNPAGAFIQAIIAIYNGVMAFIERMKQIAQVAAAFIDSIAAIASGAIGAAANRVEQTMEGILTLVLSFLARLLGLGNVSAKVVELINKLQAKVDAVLEKIVAWIVTKAKGIFKAILGKGKASAEPKDVKRAVIRDLATHASKRFESAQELQAVLVGIQAKYGDQGLKQLHAVETGPAELVEIHGVMSPGERYGVVKTHLGLEMKDLDLVKSVDTALTATLNGAPVGTGRFQSKSGQHAEQALVNYLDEETWSALTARDLERYVLTISINRSPCGRKTPREPDNVDCAGMLSRFYADKRAKLGRRKIGFQMNINAISLYRGRIDADSPAILALEELHAAGVNIDVWDVVKALQQKGVRNISQAIKRPGIVSKLERKIDKMRDVLKRVKRVRSK